MSNLNQKSLSGNKFDFDNNFDGVRLILAIIILFSQAYALNSNESDPISLLFTYEYSGTLAIWGFLVISGFLSAKSLEYLSITRFLISRFLRFYPAFVCVILIESLIVAPWFYQGLLSEYFQHWFWAHMSNLQIWGQNPGVPNVFQNLHHPVINGALWTLSLGISFIVILIVFSSLSLKPYIYIVIFLASIGGVFALKYFDIGYMSSQPTVLKGITVYAFLNYSVYFWAGVCIWKLRELVDYSLGGVALVLMVLFAGNQSFLSPLILALSLPYLVMYAALSSDFGSKLKKVVGDLSFGVFLYSYPVVNIIVSLTEGKVSNGSVFVLAMGVTMVLAYISWHTIEKPCIALKVRIFDKKPVPVA